MNGEGQGSEWSAGFTQVLAVHALMDLVEDGEGGVVTIEQSPGIVDCERVDARRTTTSLVRGRSGPHPHTILSGDLWAALRRWTASDAPEVAHVFCADGTVFPSAVSAVAERLARFGAMVESDEDEAVVRAAGIDPGSAVLRHVRLQVRAGLALATLDAVRWRLGRLPGVRPSNGCDVDAAIDPVFARCAAAGLSGAPETISRSEALELAGVCADLDDHARWTPDLASRYSLAVHASSRDSEPRPEDPYTHGRRVLANIRRRERRVAVLAGGGDGRGVDDDVLVEAAVEGGAVPVVLDARGGALDSLQTAVRRRVEAVTGLPLSAAGARDLLCSPDLVLLLDGVDEEPAVGGGWAAEATAALARNPSLGVLVLGWSRAVPPPLHLRAFHSEDPA